MRNLTLAHRENMRRIPARWIAALLACMTSASFAGPAIAAHLREGDRSRVIRAGDSFVVRCSNKEGTITNLGIFKGHRRVNPVAVTLWRGATRTHDQVFVRYAKTTKDTMAYRVRWTCGAASQRVGRRPL